MRTDYSVIVLGLGGIGSGAAYWLARRAGRDVLGIEQFALGHVRGESGDHSRIIRKTYDAAHYVRLAQQSYAAWEELETEAGEQLIFRTGEVNFFPGPATVEPMDAELVDLRPDGYIACMAAEGVPFEVLDPDEVARRFPQFRLDDSITTIYQPDGGLAAAARCTAAHQRMARAHGASLVENAGRCRIRASGDGYEVATEKGTFSAKKLVVAAGPWTNDVLAQLGTRLPLTVTQEQVTYFKPPQPEPFALDRFPVWIWMTDPCLYGFPIYGEAGVKIGFDRFEAVTAETRRFEPDPQNEQDARSFLERYIPGSVGPVIYSKTCIMTLTPAREFVIDRVPGHENCFVAIGAGHAFKFASVIGQVLSELALDGETEKVVAPFAIDRPALTAPHPVTTWPTRYPPTAAQECGSK